MVKLKAQELIEGVELKERLSSKERRKLLRDVSEKVEKEKQKQKEAKLKRTTKLVKVRGKKGKVTTKRVSMGEYRKLMVKGIFKGKSEKKAVKKREKAVKGVLGAFGIIQGKASGGGAGRPKGTYKYGMPIHLYKKMQRDKRLAYQRYQQERQMKLSSKGFTPEQIQQLQQQQAIREIQEPEGEEEYEDEDYEEDYEDYEEQQVQQVQQRPPQRKGYGRILPRSQQIRPGRSVADDELDFTQWGAEKTVSPRTQRVLDTIRRIQNKGKRDNIETQRRHRERRMVSESTNLLRAHENMINPTMDFTGVPEDNILKAKNVWKHNPENNILRKRRNLLDARSYGNQLKFF